MFLLVPVSVAEALSVKALKMSAHLFFVTMIAVFVALLHLLRKGNLAEIDTKIDENTAEIGATMNENIEKNFTQNE